MFWPVLFKGEETSDVVRIVDGRKKFREVAPLCGSRQVEIEALLSSKLAVVVVVVLIDIVYQPNTGD